MLFRQCCLVVALLVSARAASISRADFVLHFVDTGNRVISELNVDPGELISFGLILTQSNGEMRLSTEGLNLFDASIASDNSGFGNPTAISLDSSFDDSPFAATTIAGEAYEFHGVAPGLSSDAFVEPNFSADSISDSIFLGTGTYSVDALATGSTTLTAVGIPSGFFQSFVLASSDPFFATQFNPTSASLTLNVSSIPEPSSVALLGLVVGGWRLRRGRTKRS